MSGSEPTDAEAKKNAWVSGNVPPAYANDPKFKKYTQQVEKCLSSFDSVHEWADFISFLKQLLKTFQAYMQFKEIPRKVIVAKRLSQCLNPALPTGVHQRALDVYAHILAVLGSEGLSRDLAIWSSGLFPFFEYAATSVKPILLNLFDTHYLPLQAGLRPVMKAFILALLPGLEEETGEFFDKTMGLLDRLSGTVAPAFFLQNVWLIMLTSPPARGTSLNFLSRRLPRLKPDEDIGAIVGRDIGLMIRAISAALEDDDSLVRRSALDILLQSLPVDGVAVKKASPEDRSILMRAATSVVLRRDLALNRRLYTWLLGTEEASQQQVAYLKTNALGLLTLTLKEAMFKPPSEYSASRPFKIFISLLDKYEIGLPLTEALVFDAFKALKLSIECNSDPGEEATMTASTLYEAVEPQALWKELLHAVLKDLVPERSGCEGVRMVQYILTTYHTHDEEIEAIHLPIVFTAILEALKTNVSSLPKDTVCECMNLLLEIWKHIRLSYLKDRPQINGDGAAQPSSALSFASSFYGFPSEDSANESVTPSSSTIAATLHQLSALSISLAQILLDSQNHTSAVRESLISSIQLFTGYVQQLQTIPELVSPITWESARWLSIMLSCLESKNSSFSVVDHVVSTAVKLQTVTRLQPKFNIDNRQVMAAFANPLLGYLRPPWASYHVRAVSLIWDLESRARHPQVVSVVSESLTCKDLRRMREAYDAFSVLWRLTDDSLQPGLRLKIPMMIVLDTLRSEDPNLRRIGETWMRCSLKSYLRVLDPLLHDLCDPTIHRIQTVSQHSGRQVQGFFYVKPFDQRYITHLLGILLSIVKFGGQGFTRIARTTLISRSLYTGLTERTRDVGGGVADATYMDILVTVLLRFLQSEPNLQLAHALRPLNESLQSATVDLLQNLTARGEIDMIALQSVESAIIGKLYYCVHTGRLDIQNKLLHLLHSTISALNGQIDAELQKSSRITQGEQSIDGPRPQAPISTSYSVNPLLIHTLIDGISTSSNRPILQHWLDFILMTIPQFHDMLQPAILPLNECVCRQLRNALGEITAASRARARAEDVAAYNTDADFVMLINAVERLALISLSHIQQPSTLEDDMLNEKPNQESSGLLGYMSNVFSSDSGAIAGEDQQTTKATDTRGLHESIRVLYAIWDQFTLPLRADWDSQEESLSLIYSRARTRCRRALEHLFRAHPLEVLESVIDCWSRTRKDEPSGFELVDVLTSSSQNVVNMLCDCILVRNPGASDRPKRHSLCPTLSDITMFEFLEQYFGRLEGPLAVQVWIRFVQLCKDFTGAYRDFKLQIFSALRCFNVLADKLTQTSIVEDKRVRKELQDTFTKLIDICLLAVRSNDSSSWIRRGQLANGSGRESPIPRARSTLGIDEKMNASSASLIDGSKSIGPVDAVEQVNAYLASDVIPNMRKFLVEGDRISAACSSIVSAAVSPALKSRAKPLDVDNTVLAVLRETARIPAAIKAWRGPIVDILNDNRCFNSSPSAGKEWKLLVKMLFETDKTALTELLSRITTAPSANIFANKEYEMLLRSLNLRRLSYVILTGEKNQFLTQLPTIQEKLVDTLRNVAAPIVQSEVYLCVRILLCRLSPHNLSSFWPVILTELLRVFESVLVSLPSDGSEDLSLILAATKLLDLILVLQTEEFQIHQWIFITDTVDAIFPPDRWIPIALLDRLAEVVVQQPSEGAAAHAHHAPVDTPLLDQRPMRRPLLQMVRSIDSIRDLGPFFSQASITSYESVYSSGGVVDWVAVEDGLYQDMFDGR